MTTSTNAELSALDFVAIVVAALAALALAAFPLAASSFAAVFRDLGGRLPLLTRIVLVPWQPVVAVAAGGAIAFGVRAKRPIRVRRVAIAAAFTVAFFAFAASAIGLYLPIFSLAGQIRAD